MTKRICHGATGLLLLLSACAGADADLEKSPDLLPDAGMQHDDKEPAIPVLAQGLPSRQPYKVVTLRGNADGAERVLVEAEGLNPLTVPVGTQGTFCIDVPVSEPGAYTFNLTAHSHGILSPTNAFTTEYDPAAPALEGARTCTGADPAGCGSDAEICGNQRDDNCNGLADGADPACDTCDHDYLEPNNDVSAPAVEPGSYDGLFLCAGEQDHFGVLLGAGDTLYAKAYFSVSEGNLDLQVVSEDGSKVLASAATFTNDEEVTYLATAAGRYVVRVKGYSASDTANYSLFLRVTSAP